MATIIKGLRRPSPSDEKQTMEKVSLTEPTIQEFVVTKEPLVCISDLIGSHAEEISPELHMHIDSIVTQIANAAKLLPTAIKSIDPKTMASITKVLKEALDGVMTLFKNLPKNSGFRKYLNDAVSNLSRTVVTGKGGLAEATVNSIKEFSEVGHVLVDQSDKLTNVEKKAMNEQIDKNPTGIFDKKGEFSTRFNETFKGKTFKGVDPQAFAAGASIAYEGFLRVVKFVGTPIFAAIGGGATIAIGGVGSVGVVAAFRSAMNGLIVIQPALISTLGPSIFGKIQEIVIKLIDGIKDPKNFSLKGLFAKASPKEKVAEVNAAHAAKVIIEEPLPTDVGSMLKLIETTPPVEKLIETTPPVENLIETASVETPTTLTRALVRSLIGPHIDDGSSVVIDKEGESAIGRPDKERMFGNYKRYIAKKRSMPAKIKSLIGPHIDDGSSVVIDKEGESAIGRHDEERMNYKRYIAKKRSMPAKIKSLIGTEGKSSTDRPDKERMLGNYKRYIAKKRSMPAKIKSLIGPNVGDGLNVVIDYGEPAVDRDENERISTELWNEVRSMPAKINSLIGPTVDDTVPVIEKEVPTSVEKKFTDEHIEVLRKHLRSTVPLNNRQFKTKAFYRAILIRRLELEDQPLQQIMQEFEKGLETSTHPHDNELHARNALHRLTVYYLRNKKDSNGQIMSYAIKNMATQILLQSHPFFK